MEVLRLPGYDSPEKMTIAKEYVIPTSCKKTGLQTVQATNESFGLTEDAILMLIKQYCRENGVRNLEKHVEKVFRKMTLEVVESSEKKQTVESQEAGETTAQDVDDQDRFQITPDKLSKYVGKPIFTSYAALPSKFPGAVMGLAWTALGGSALYIETTSVWMKNDRAGLIATGQMGSVMEESTKLAYTFARTKLRALDPANLFSKSMKYTFMFPKEQRPRMDLPLVKHEVPLVMFIHYDIRTVQPELAMTGELYLVGKVLPIGGVKEKTIAAKRSGVKTLI
ncbi:hypothetical protein PsorP6_016569 [Peronosclerospora sorghi]|uniref:Uncharacterized protein n=1 Tax=Peronosclerospora sorghi TaxID=230839 RepID=A0ACC0VKZ0_9STRA|nr:hypothetical protein PsorP6_016569 [Peronosclerospora sorghi]